MARQSLFLTLLLAALPAAAETRARYVMGTMLTVTAATATAAEASLDEAARWDRLLSTYKPESEVSRLNAAAPEAVSVSTDTAAALKAALGWARATDGAFDPVIGAVIRAWNFDAPQPAVPSERAISEAVAASGWRRLTVEGTRARLSSEGAEVDLGGIGKGWALDRALEKARAAGAAEVTMDFGGQLLFWSVDEKARWPAMVRGRLKAFTVPVGSLSTSSQLEKNFVLSGAPYPRHGPGGAGRSSEALLAGAVDRESMEGLRVHRFGHVLNPRTGWPVESLGSVTVWAPTAEAADALSTALLVMGTSEGSAWAEREGVAALFIDEGGRETATPAWKEKIR